MDTPEERFEMWARVDLFGHNQRVGKLSVLNTGVEMLYRLDIPNKDNTGDAFTTEFYGNGAVYSIMPVSEPVARLIASKLGAAAPISQYDLPQPWRDAISAAKALTATIQGETLGGPVPEVDDDDGDDDRDDRDDDEEDF